MQITNERLNEMISIQKEVADDATRENGTVHTLDSEILSALKELKEYRDIGPTPEQLKEVDRLYLEKCREVDELKRKINNPWTPASEIPEDMKTDCPYNDMAEKQKSATEKRKEAQEINRKNGVDVRKLVKLRIRAQLSLVEAAEIVGVRTAQYKAWEWEREPIPIDKYNELLKRFKQEISNQKCNNCRYFNGEKFCYWTGEETHENCVCKFWGRRYAR